MDSLELSGDLRLLGFVCRQFDLNFKLDAFEVELVKSICNLVVFFEQHSHFDVHDFAFDFVGKFLVMTFSDCRLGHPETE